MEIERKERERQTPLSVGLHQVTHRGSRIPPKVLRFLLIQISLQLALVTQRIFQFYNTEKLWRLFGHFSKIQKSDFWFPTWSRLSKLSSLVMSCCMLRLSPGRRGGLYFSLWCFPIWRWCTSFCSRVGCTN